MNFYSYSSVFPIIILVWNINQTIMKDYHVQSCQWMAYDRFRQTIQDHHNVGMLKIFIYSLLSLAEYQCKGMVINNLRDLFFSGQFRRSWKRLYWKNLLLTVIAITRIINQFKYFKFPIFIFYFRPALSFKRQFIINFFILNFTGIEIQGERVSSSQNERTLGGGGGRGVFAKTNNGEQWGRENQKSGILSERTSWMSPN